MSGQWEVVGKNRQTKNDKKLSKSERLKLVENAPKVEDILPLSQVKTLFSPLDNKENKRPPPKETSKENEAKRTPKKHVEKKKEIEKKPAVPKTLEHAAKQINVRELDSELELSRARFPDAPLAWLKGLVEYLNVKLDHTNRVTSPKSLDYPLCVIPKDVREVIEKSLNEVSPSTLQHFFEMCIIAMANDLSKGSSAIYGYKVLIQMLVFSNPSISVDSIPKVVVTLNSYQNRPPIGLAILWAVGQGGIKNLKIGLKVWEEIMFPLLEKKNYTSFVISYLRDILNSTSKTDDLDEEQFLQLSDMIFSPALTIPSHFKQDLIDVFELLHNLMFAKKTRSYVNIFRGIFERLCPTASAEFRLELLKCLVTCLSRDPSCFQEWKDLHLKYLDHSLVLLKFTSVAWNDVENTLNKKLLSETLNHFLAVNKTVNSQEKKYKSVKDFNRVIEDILQKMSHSAMPQRNWIVVNFFLFACIVALLYYDTNKHGSFRGSSTGRFLKDYGLLHYVESGMVHMESCYRATDVWIGNNAPHFLQGLSKKASPWVHQFMDLVATVVKHVGTLGEKTMTMIVETSPVLFESVVRYLVILGHTLNVYTTVVLVSIKDYLAAFFTFLANSDAFKWTKDNVLVGPISPENITKYSWGALNATQTYAQWTLEWIVEHVDGFMKSKSE